MKTSRLLATLGLAALLTACSTNNTSSSSDSTAKTTKTTWETVQERGELIVATPMTYQPTSYYNDKKELVGYEVDMMKEIGQRLKLKVTFVETAFDQAFSSVDSGRVDVSLNNLDITPERLEKYNISEAYKYSVSGLIVRADGSSGISAKDLSDWAGKKAAGAAGTNYMKIAKKQGAELVTYDNVAGDVYLNDVANGRTDFIPNDYISQKLFVDAMKKDNPDLNVKVSDVIYNPSQQGIIMSNKDDSLFKKIDEALLSMKEDGSLAKLAVKYYGEDVSKPYESDQEIPTIDISDVSDAG
ncbi:transporter substrate-binding domain-containing protein [Streptococcus cuniculipharyngis]|uniref:Transporter substrate-binding domain-containing protein n=1 Tax=Streptococcus cuniculipharyngis TaxID=1562651 RepID=A0A5C5SEZ5_9STRE|nr:transporter substrate-binding domain-containing protein [Streptococcus cuniculipharyngis]TWS98872.1 transporter substrate-binding domain-containing protein [Streptococcus cuniculipharyngis]